MSGMRSVSKQVAAIRRALQLTSEAMDVLDANHCSPEAAVHLDLCRQKLQEDFTRLDAAASGV